MVAGPVPNVWSVGMGGICLALVGIAGSSLSPSWRNRLLLRFLPTRAGSWRDTQVMVFAPILPYGLGLLFHVFRRPQLRVILDGTADLPRRRRCVASLDFETKSRHGTLPLEERLLRAR